MQATVARETETQDPTFEPEKGALEPAEAKCPKE